MDMYAAYREVGSYRAAADICGTTPKTVKRSVNAAEQAQAGSGSSPGQVAHNYDGVAELVARLRVALKHRFHTEGTRPVLRLGSLEIDLVNRRVARGGQEINLTKTEYEILCILASHPGKVLTHDFILRNVRGGENVGDPQYLRVYVRSLRNKLGDRSPSRRIIRTEMGVGYRLVAPPPEPAGVEST